MKHDIPQSLDTVVSQCRALGVSVDSEFHRKVSIFGDLLHDCSKRVNLVGPGETERLWSRHILESVAFAGFLTRCPVVDVGTGAGFPGLILALLGFDVTMVEPRGKRCSFLEVAARECDIECTIRNSRIESAGPFSPGTQFTARAVKEPGLLISLVSPSAAGSFTLFTRVPEESTMHSPSYRIVSLPIPPLDRPGFMLQYSHS